MADDDTKGPDEKTGADEGLAELQDHSGPFDAKTRAIVDAILARTDDGGNGIQNGAEGYSYYWLPDITLAGGKAGPDPARVQALDARGWEPLPKSDKATKLGASKGSLMRCPWHRVRAVRMAEAKAAGVRLVHVKWKDDQPDLEDAFLGLNY